MQHLHGKGFPNVIILHIFMVNAGGALALCGKPATYERTP